MSRYQCPNCKGYFQGAHYCIGGQAGSTSYKVKVIMRVPKVQKSYIDNDGYPTDEALNKIAKWNYTDGWDELVKFVMSIWNWPDLATCTDVLNYWNKPVRRLKLVTGGWSGNEDIISALQKNYMFWSLCWQESHRGGKHIFEIKKEEKK